MKIKLLILMLILLINSVTATCTVTFDKTSYAPTETVTATILCNQHPSESTKSYTLNWTNSSGDQIELDTGTTPKADGTNYFFETYVLSSGYSGAINTTLQGTGLEGTDGANVTGASSNSLIVSSITFSSSEQLYLGKNLGIGFILKDENAKKINNAICTVAIDDGDNLPIVEAKKVMVYNGKGQADFELTDNAFGEGKDYKVVVRCVCGITSTSSACFDENGTEVSSSIGEGSDTFTLNTYLTVNTVVDRSLYYMKEEIFICSNVTNVNLTTRIPMKIFYQIRCSAGIDTDSDTDRVLIASNPEDESEERGISTNTTQMQCKRFIIPEPKYLQGQNSECYASSSVWVLNDLREPVTGYFTTSPVFNLSSDELNLNPDWEQISTNKFNTIINLSAVKYRQFNGGGIGNIDLMLSEAMQGSIDSFKQYSGGTTRIEDFISAKYIKNITATNSSGSSVTAVLEFLSDGCLEIALRSIDISSTGFYNITIEFNDWEERQSDALEGIENKTGTFHLDVNCPSSGIIGSNIACIITAYVEDSQTVQKEVDFTCHISDGTSQYSSVNFNQMITQNAVSLSRNFAIPSTFSDGTQYVLQCYADYYNLGSRRDSFYDTFTASSPSVGGGASGISRAENETNGASITGGIVDEGDEKEDKDIGDIFKKFNPFSPKRNWAFIFVEIIILTGIVSLICFFVRRNKRKSHHYHSGKSNWEEVMKKVLAGIIILLIISLLGAGIWYGYGIIKNSFQGMPTIEQTTLSGIEETSYLLLKGNLIKSIFLIFLAVLIISLIIIIFTAVLTLIVSRLLNIKGEIRFGNDHSRKYYEDRKSTKLQQKLNQMILKKEIKKEKLKESCKVKKMTPKQFADFVRRRK